MYLTRYIPSGEKFQVFISMVPESSPFTHNQNHFKFHLEEKFSWCHAKIGRTIHVYFKIKPKLFIFYSPQRWSAWCCARQELP